MRVSTNWDNTNLTQEQIDYACLDVYAAWAIHQAFTDMPVGSLVTVTLTGTHVRLLSWTGNSTIAYGVVAPDWPAKFNRVNVTKTQTIINVTSVVQPAYLVCADLLASQQAAPLSSFGDTFPFSLLCFVRLKTFRHVRKVSHIHPVTTHHYLPNLIFHFPVHNHHQLVPLLLILRILVYQTKGWILIQKRSSCWKAPDVIRAQS